MIRSTQTKVVKGAEGVVSIPSRVFVSGELTVRKKVMGLPPSATLPPSAWPALSRDACSLHGVLGGLLLTWSGPFPQFLKLSVSCQNEFANDYVASSHNPSEFTSIRNETAEGPS